MLFAHSLRVYLFGAIQGRHRGWAVDHELLYVGAMFHDLGLTAKYRSPDHRFEVDGANAARDFLRANGIDEGSAGVVWDAIALHTTLEIPWHKRPEIALLNGGTAADVIGRGLDEIPVGDREAVLAAYPRVDFECGSSARSWTASRTGPRPHSGRSTPTCWSGRCPATAGRTSRGIVRAFADGFAYKPATAFGTMNADVLERTLPGYRRPNFCDLIAANPLGG